MKFRETWQTGSICFNLVGARFPGKSIGPVFFTAVKDINLQKSKNLALQTLLFPCLKFRIPLDAMCCENVERFHRRKFKIITNKAIKRKTTQICLGIYNSRINPTILTEMIEKHYSIIAYYM